MGRTAVLLAAAAAALAAAQCDQEYECEFKSDDAAGAYYDLRELCRMGTPYIHENPTENTTYVFQVCGNTQHECHPPYPVEYARGAAIQFFGDEPAPGSMCTTAGGETVPCTRDCEILGVGVPIITLIDEKQPFLGVNITHYGVPSLPTDRFQCPFDPLTGAPMEREVTMQILCDHSAITRATIVRTYEYATCRYLIILKSAYGCGCRPNCFLKNCGSDGCHGFCGPVGVQGQCPMNSTCISGQCCKPDCNNRQCGQDGCGGTCGTCGANEECTKFQQCYNPATPVTPSPIAKQTTISTTTGSDKFAAFMGGIISSAFIGLSVTYYLRYRASS